MRKNKNYQTSQPKLLLDSPPLLVLPELAVLIGLNEAIVLQQIHYWELANSRAERNFKDGHYWTYNSYQNWQKQFAFWSIETIKRIFTNLERKELIITGNYNQLKIDRTKWYRVNHEALDALLYVSGNGRVNLTSPLGQFDTMGVNSGLNG